MNRENLHILAVDDDPQMREVLERILVEEGFRVTLAKDGKDALEKVQEVSPGLVLTDLQMPGMDGIDLIFRIQEIPKFAKLPILILSGSADPNQEEFAMDAGAVGWLVKPFSMIRLLRLIREA